MYVAPGYGVACNPDDSASIERAFRLLIADPEKMRAMGEQGRERIEREWNYEAQFDEVLRCLERRPDSRQQPHLVKVQ
jgi:glycosyltransferase involved in cell wall biosynthesis